MLDLNRIPRVTQLANNQFLIKYGVTTIFQSYNSTICIINKDDVILGKDWKRSPTTSKYRARILGESTKTTEVKLQKAIYTLNNSL